MVTPLFSSIRADGEEVTIGAISGPSEALPSSEALEIPEAREGRELRVAKALAPRYFPYYPYPAHRRYGKLYGQYVLGILGYKDTMTIRS